MPATEVEDAVRKAYQGDGWQPGTGEKNSRCSREVPAAFIARGKDASEAAAGQKRSPVPIPSEPSAGDVQVVLGAIWQADEAPTSGTHTERKLKTVREWQAELEAGQPVPPHVIPNSLKPVMAG